MLENSFTADCLRITHHHHHHHILISILIRTYHQLEPCRNIQLCLLSSQLCIDIDLHPLEELCRWSESTGHLQHNENSMHGNTEAIQRVQQQYSCHCSIRPAVSTLLNHIWPIWPIWPISECSCLLEHYHLGKLCAVWCNIAQHLSLSATWTHLKDGLLWSMSHETHAGTWTQALEYWCSLLSACPHQCVEDTRLCSSFKVCWQQRQGWRNPFSPDWLLCL